MGVDEQPVENTNRIWSIFFIVHFFIGNIMVFNAFTGVMVQKFNEINEKFGNSLIKIMRPSMYCLQVL